MNVPDMPVGCGSHRYVTEPGVKFTIHVSCPVPSTLVAHPCGGTQETDEPTKWKLCMAEKSSTSTVYDPCGSEPPFRSCPFGSVR